MHETNIHVILKIIMVTATCSLLNSKNADEFNDLLLQQFKYNTILKL